jgi:hypothetical protein
VHVELDENIGRQRTILTDANSAAQYDTNAPHGFASALRDADAVFGFLLADLIEHWPWLSAYTESGPD